MDLSLYQVSETHIFKLAQFCLLGDEWKMHRKFLNVAFNQQILNSFMGTFASYSNTLIGKLEVEAGNDLFDLVPILSRYTLDVVAGKSKLLYSN